MRSRLRCLEMPVVATRSRLLQDSDRAAPRRLQQVESSIASACQNGVVPSRSLSDEYCLTLDLSFELIEPNAVTTRTVRGRVAFHRRHATSILPANLWTIENDPIRFGGLAWAGWSETRDT
jgi:hypothetical protein